MWLNAMTALCAPSQTTSSWREQFGDDARRRAHAASGLERAHSRFAWPVVARAHLAFFDAVTEAGPA